MKDAGCGAAEAADIRRLCEAGQIQDVILILRRHRCRLMDDLHESQGRVDCLDYLVYKMKKELKEDRSS